MRAIIQMPLPQNREELQRFLGMVNYFPQFIRNQSEITAPLRSLLKKDVAWNWFQEHTQPVENLKDILSSQPILKFFEPSKPVKLQVDVSKSGLGACILQDGHPIAYASRSLIQAEEYYAQKECLLQLREWLLNAQYVSSIRERTRKSPSCRLKFLRGHGRSLVQTYLNWTLTLI